MKLKFVIIFLILFLNNLNLFSQTITNNKLIKPEYLKKGDTVAIVAPSGVLKNYNGYILKAKELLKSWELEVVIGENVFNDLYFYLFNETTPLISMPYKLFNKCLQNH